MSGGGSSSAISGQRKDLAQGAGVSGPLSSKDNFEGRPHPEQTAHTGRTETGTVLVCGGRDYSDQFHVYNTLSAIHAETPVTRVIEGGATGADMWGRLWGHEVGVEVVEYPADWKNYGRKAGPLRNQLMIHDGKPDLVVAFPGGRGTADMVRRARAAGIKVIEPRPSPAGGRQ